MTVKELIEKLSHYKDDELVVIDSDVFSHPKNISSVDLNQEYKLAFMSQSKYYLDTKVVITIKK